MPRFDTSVQVRIEMQALATLAAHYHQEGKVLALKSASALVRQAIYDTVHIITHDGTGIVPVHEAEEVLVRRGIFPRVSRTGQLQNLHEEDSAAEPRQRHAPSTLQPMTGTALVSTMTQALEQSLRQFFAAHEHNEGTVESEPDAGEFQPEKKEHWLSS